MVVAKTFERYKTMKVGQLKYINSMQFMNNSLANLTKNLDTNYLITSQHFKNYSLDQISLASHKGVYSYDYINSQDRFKKTELPPIYEFYSTLKGKITQDDSKKYRKLLVLDFSHYVLVSALAWDTMLKIAGVKIELFIDMAMHDFIKKAKCEGIAMACKCYFKANNPKMDNVFNLSKPTTWISYINANNLYSWAISQYLPIGNYKWKVSHKYFKNNPNEQKKYLNKILNTEHRQRSELPPYSELAKWVSVSPVP
ncbi:hypothetical protein C2G38_2192456 [Gigaspora rosea]|uniref:DNA-directed DNA polymerase n=1 Tax=Gigaspora rosea TaxID=44941 RepID=A0A397V0J9_9GLOM|nr:hypothetical protein C2G38_2192456 [Gigaspora rosea]